MSTFGIESFGDTQAQRPDRFFVGQDSALWDWILAENYFPVPGQPDMATIEAPEGHRFHYGNLFPEAELQDADEVSRYISAPKRTAGAAKVHSLFEMLEEVSPDEFAARKIDQYRIVSVATPKLGE